MIIVVVIDRLRTQSGESFSIVQYVQLILAVNFSVQLLLIYTDFHLSVIFLLFPPCFPAFR